MGYEDFRKSVVNQLAALHPELTLDTVQSVLEAVDVAALQYDFEPKVTALTVYGATTPQIVDYYIQSLSLSNRAKSTLVVYKRIVSNFLKTVGKPIDRIDVNDARAYLNLYRARRGVMDSTLEHIRNTLNGFFSWAVDEDIIQKNPFKRIDQIKYRESTRKAMTRIELEEIRAACETPREKALVDLLFSTGARVSEVMNINLDNINWDTCEVFIEHGKGDKPRITYLNAEAIVSLRAYIATRNDCSKALFVTERAPHHRLGVKSIQTEIAGICNRAGTATHVTPHVFRHTTATTALNNGMAIDEVRTLLGHSNINTTMRYAKTDREDVRHDHRKFVN